MKDRHSRVAPGRLLMSSICAVSLAVGSLFLLSESAAAKVRGESMSYGICEMLEKQPVDPALLEQIRARADFAQIVDFVERNCGGLIDPLVGPTNTIAAPRDNRNGTRGVPRAPIPDEKPIDDGKDDEEVPDPKEK